MPVIEAVKRSTLAGTWYPRDPERLRETVRHFLAAVPETAARPVFGLIVPHAGYPYSGAVAGLAFAQLRGTRVRRVVVLAPSHRSAFRGVAVLDVQAFETPLGRVAVDPAALSLLPDRLWRVDPAPFEGEHALEIQLPFLQSVAPQAAVVPILVGAVTESDCRALAQAIHRLVDEESALVVSSDFTHYGSQFGYEPFPARDADFVREKLRALDMAAIEPILAGEATAFRRHIERTGDTVCGRSPISILLSWPGGPGRGELLGYRTSLDVTGDYEHSVSYAAIAFRRPPAGA